MRSIRKISLLTLFAVMGILLTGCGGYSERSGEKMMKKFENGDMTKDDYAKCLDVLDEYIQDMDKEIGELIANSSNEKKFIKGLEELDERSEDKWGGVEDLGEIFEDSDEKEIGSSNMKRLNKLVEKAQKKFFVTYREKIAKKYDGVPTEYDEFLEDL